jgi:plastocyanin
LTAGGVTATGTTTVSVQVPPATAAVSAPELAFQPKEVDVSAAGVVTWYFGQIHHSVTFTIAGAPADVPELRNGSAAREFPDPGTFTYRCTIHPSMTGTVRVH